MLIDKILFFTERRAGVRPPRVLSGKCLKLNWWVWMNWNTKCNRYHITALPLAFQLKFESTSTRTTDAFSVPKKRIGFADLCTQEICANILKIFFYWKMQIDIWTCVFNSIICTCNRSTIEMKAKLKCNNGLLAHFGRMSEVEVRFRKTEESSSFLILIANFSSPNGAFSIQVQDKCF